MYRGFNVLAAVENRDIKNWELGGWDEGDLRSICRRASKRPFQMLACSILYLNDVIYCYLVMIRRMKMMPIRLNAQSLPSRIQDPESEKLDY